MSGAKLTQEQMEAARKAMGLSRVMAADPYVINHIIRVAQAIADAVVEERERCARIADKAALRQWSATTTRTVEAISKLIRKGIDK